MTAYSTASGRFGDESWESATSDTMRGLTPLGQRDRDFERLAGAHDFDAHGVAGHLAAQGVGEIVQVLDGLAVEFDHHVVGFEARLGGGRAWRDVGELDAADAFAEIGHGTEVRAVSGDIGAGGGRSGGD